jgi:hypothetical protein
MAIVVAVDSRLALETASEVDSATAISIVDLVDPDSWVVDLAALRFTVVVSVADLLGLSMHLFTRRVRFSLQSMVVADFTVAVSVVDFTAADEVAAEVGSATDAIEANTIASNLN